jgi:hypothetical protein
MTITAKYPGKCRRCGGAIAQGERIEWVKGGGSSHVSCPESPQPAPKAQRGASERQRAFIAKLFGEREVGDDTMFQTDPSANPTLDSATASQLIERLLELPKKESEDEGEGEGEKPDVPAGRYAVRIANTEWDLLRVWRGTRNPSIVQVYRVKGTEQGERLSREEERGALLVIAEDPAKAAVEFGHRTGSCSRCGTELDVNLSRKLGIGPECMKHWFSNEDRLERMREAREQLRAAGLEPTEKFDSLAVVA